MRLPGTLRCVVYDSVNVLAVYWPVMRLPGTLHRNVPGSRTTGQYTASTSTES
jgi:hypothetical protein